jgi:hypothetical protein
MPARSAGSVTRRSRSASSIAAISRSSAGGRSGRRRLASGARSRSFASETISARGASNGSAPVAIW